VSVNIFHNHSRDTITLGNVLFSIHSVRLWRLHVRWYFILVLTNRQLLGLTIVNRCETPTTSLRRRGQTPFVWFVVDSLHSLLYNNKCTTKPWRPCVSSQLACRVLIKYYYTLLRHKAAINNNKTYRHLQCYIGLICHSINTKKHKNIKTHKVANSLHTKKSQCQQMQTKYSA